MLPVRIRSGLLVNGREPEGFTVLVKEVEIATGTDETCGFLLIFVVFYLGTGKMGKEVDSCNLKSKR